MFLSQIYYLEEIRHLYRDLLLPVTKVYLLIARSLASVNSDLHSHHQDFRRDNCFAVELSVKGQYRSAISAIGDVAHGNGNMLWQHCDISHAMYGKNADFGN